MGQNCSDPTGVNISKRCPEIQPYLKTSAPSRPNLNMASFHKTKLLHIKLTEKPHTFRCLKHSILQPKDVRLQVKCFSSHIPKIFLPSHSFHIFPQVLKFTMIQKGKASILMLKRPAPTYFWKSMCIVDHTQTLQLEGCCQIISMTMLFVLPLGFLVYTWSLPSAPIKTMYSYPFKFTDRNHNEIWEKEQYVSF